MDEDLSRAFELTGDLEDAGLDIEAIFKADDGTADTMPPFGEAEPVSAASGAKDAAPEEPKEPATPDETPAEEPKDAGEMEPPPPADVEPEPDIFAAFAEDKTAPPAPKQEVMPAPAGQVSIFDKPPVFSYGGHKDKIRVLEIKINQGHRDADREAVQKLADKMFCGVFSLPGMYAARISIDWTRKEAVGWNSLPIRENRLRPCRAWTSALLTRAPFGIFGM